MTYRCQVTTYFDCTETNIKNHKKVVELDKESWTFKRNQQRNFETILQCVSMLTQPLNIETPQLIKTFDGLNCWLFTFEYDRDMAFHSNGNPYGALEDACRGVPMLLGLNENYKELFFTPYLVTSGSHTNIFFD